MISRGQHCIKGPYGLCGTEHDPETLLCSKGSWAVLGTTLPGGGGR